MRKITFISILVILLVGTGYIYWFYYNPYSEGSREGVLQKFSRKGNIFKTYEGEMIQLGFGQRGAAINSQYYYFSVDDPQIADSLENCLGKIVRLHYIQYRKTLPWRGENYNKQNAEKGQYVVDRIEKVENAIY
jgi:hypothetical protein